MLDDIFFFFVNSVAVDVNFDDDLVLLAVAAVAGVVAEAVLAAHERIDGLQDGSEFAFKGDGEVGATGLFGESAERVLRLNESEASGEAAERAAGGPAELEAQKANWVPAAP